MSDIQMNEIRIKRFTHPDSIDVPVWVVEQRVPATGKYASPGDMYWKNQCNNVEMCFTDPDEAQARAMEISNEV